MMSKPHVEFGLVRRGCLPFQTFGEPDRVLVMAKH